MKRRGFLTSLLAIPFAPLLAKIETKRLERLAKRQRIIDLLNAKANLLQAEMKRQVDHYAFSNSLKLRSNENCLLHSNSSLKVRSYTDFDPIDFSYGQTELHQGNANDCNLCGCSPAEYEWKQLPGYVHISDEIYDKL